MKTKKRMLWLAVITLGLLTCAGCCRLNRTPTCEEQAMVRETLDVTSPRAENNQPKAIPEFKFTFGGSKKCKEQPYPTPEDVVTDRDIRLDNR